MAPQTSITFRKGSQPEDERVICMVCRGDCAVPYQYSDYDEAAASLGLNEELSTQKSDSIPIISAKRARKAAKQEKNIQKALARKRKAEEVKAEAEAGCGFITLPCGHVYHPSCLRQCTRPAGSGSGNRCLYCRTPLRYEGCGHAMLLNSELQSGVVMTKHQFKGCCSVCTILGEEAPAVELEHTHIWAGKLLEKVGIKKAEALLSSLIVSEEGRAVYYDSVQIALETLWEHRKRKATIQDAREMVEVACRAWEIADLWAPTDDEYDEFDQLVGRWQVLDKKLHRGFYPPESTEADPRRPVTKHQGYDFAVAQSEGDSEAGEMMLR